MKRNKNDFIVITYIIIYKYIYDQIYYKQFFFVCGNTIPDRGTANTVGYCIRY